MDNSTELSSFHSQTVRLDSLKVSQLISIFGDGKLRDGSECSSRFRAFIRSAPLTRLADYVTTCLSSPFTDSGMALQDLVNELGRRLDFEVENGLYQGRSGSIGFDGLWKSKAASDIVIEVKTTDAYRINLDTVAAYRDKLITESRAKPNSSCLIIVGREDTGDLEAQVRGSRHAWTIRIISADALLRLVQLKESADEGTASKTRELLIPFEFTRLDRIIDLAFTAAAETVEGVAEEPAESAAFSPQEMPVVAERTVSYFQNHTPGDEQEYFRVGVANTLAARFGKEVVRKSRAAYWSLDRDNRAIISVSKKYPDGWYWYGYHSAWDDYLSEGKSGVFALGCIGTEDFFAIPHEFIRDRLDHLNFSPKSDGSGEVKHWHIHLQEGSGEMRLRLHKLDQFESVEQFRMRLSKSD